MKETNIDLWSFKLLIIMTTSLCSRYLCGILKLFDLWSCLLQYFLNLTLNTARLLTYIILQHTQRISKIERAAPSIGESKAQEMPFKAEEHAPEFRPILRLEKRGLPHPPPHRGVGNAIQQGRLQIGAEGDWVATACLLIALPAMTTPGLLLHLPLSVVLSFWFTDDYASHLPKKKHKKVLWTQSR